VSAAEDQAATAPPPSLRATLRRDLARYREFHAAGAGPSAARLAIESVLFKAGFQAVLLYRVSRAFHCAGRTWLAWAVARTSVALTGADIEFGARIGPGLLIAHPVGIVIGRGTVIGEDATVFQGVTCGVRTWAPGSSGASPRIGDRVVLFAKSSVLGGVRVGDRAIVGAHALVTRDVADGGLAQADAATMLDGWGTELQRAWGR
jgi:serine O-acetyltransferase